MGVVLAGVIVAVVVAVGAGFFLRSEQQETWELYSTEGTRVGEPGANLVGQNWTGNPSDDAAGVEHSAPAS